LSTRTTRRTTARRARRREDCWRTGLCLAYWRTIGLATWRTWTTNTV